MKRFDRAGLLIGVEGAIGSERLHAGGIVSPDAGDKQHAILLLFTVLEKRSRRQKGFLTLGAVQECGQDEGRDWSPRSLFGPLFALSILVAFL